MGPLKLLPDIDEGRETSFTTTKEPLLCVDDDAVDNGGVFMRR